MSALVQLDSIVKDYRSMRALDSVSLKIGGGITGLLGPNGAGKSTLIKVLLGLVKTTSGSGTVLGFRLGRDGRKIRNQVGYMPEDDCYIGGMTGVEMVRFSACLAGLPYIEALRRSHEILDFCGVQQERYRSVDGYSTGMRQKVKFAAAIVHDPSLLILDEPTSGLDPEEREALLNRVRVLATKFGKAVLLSTHILPDVQSVCNHVVILANGKVRVSDSLGRLNQTSSPTVIVKVMDRAEDLHRDLARMGIGNQIQDGGTIAVDASDPGILASIWGACRRNGIVVQSMMPAKTSLEEVFLSAIRETQHAHS